MVSRTAKSRVRSPGTTRPPFGRKHAVVRAKKPGSLCMPPLAIRGVLADRVTPFAQDARPGGSARLSKRQLAASEPSNAPTFSCC